MNDRESRKSNGSIQEDESKEQPSPSISPEQQMRATFNPNSDKTLDYMRASNNYTSAERRKDKGCLRTFFRDFPYSLFKQRRKDPVTREHVLVGQRKLEHEFEEKFWDFDNYWIARIQSFQLSQNKTVPSKILGGFLAFVSISLSIFFQLEFQMCMILSLSLHQQDAPAHRLCHMMLLNIIIVQGLKRMYHRKRPTDFQPPRALKLIVSATTFVYAAFATDSWTLGLVGLNDVPVWAAAIIALLTFFVVSFSKVHLGQNYPSDCLMSIPPILVIILLFYMLVWFDTVTNLCPSCVDANGHDSYCYFDSVEIANNDPILLTRQTFQIGDSNTLSSTWIAFVAFAGFSILSWHPIEFWHKTPYFFPTLLAIYLFKNVMLCPCAENNWRSVYSPLMVRSVSSSPIETAISFALLFFSYGTTWIVNNLLGNRTGAVLSYLIRTIFYVCILFQTLLTLITVRLIVVDQQKPASV